MFRAHRLSVGAISSRCDTGDCTVSAVAKGPPILAVSLVAAFVLFWVLLLPANANADNRYTVQLTQQGECGGDARWQGQEFGTLTLTWESGAVRFVIEANSPHGTIRAPITVDMFGSRGKVGSLQANGGSFEDRQRSDGVYYHPSREVYVPNAPGWTSLLNESHRIEVTTGGKFQEQRADGTWTSSPDCGLFGEGFRDTPSPTPEPQPEPEPEPEPEPGPDDKVEGHGLKITRFSCVQGLVSASIQVSAATERLRVSVKSGVVVLPRKQAKGRASAAKKKGGGGKGRLIPFHRIGPMRVGAGKSRVAGTIPKESASRFRRRLCRLAKRGRLRFIVLAEFRDAAGNRVRVRRGVKGERN